MLVTVRFAEAFFKEMGNVRGSKQDPPPDANPECARLFAPIPLGVESAWCDSQILSRLLECQKGIHKGDAPSPRST
jgi:hypothetical protein